MYLCRKIESNESSNTTRHPRQRHHRGQRQEPDRARIPHPVGYLRRGHKRGCNEDTSEDVKWLVKKIANLRVFGDENDVMNRSILDVNGEALVVSQFTLYASYKKGNRPSWFRAGSHEHSIPLYEAFCAQLSEAIGKQVGTGEFGADMKVELLNDGPVTICMDTKNKE